MIRSESTPPEYVLPVVYTTLDPSPILDIQRVDPLAPFPHSLVDRIVVSIEIFTGMRDKHVFSDIFPLIWERLFPRLAYLVSGSKGERVGAAVEDHTSSAMASKRGTRRRAGPPRGAERPAHP